MNEEEIKELKSLIEEYEICYKESKYEGNVEEYKGLKDTHKLLNNVLNYIGGLQKEIEDIKEYVNSPEFLDWNLGFKLIDELEYRKDRINKLLGGENE